MKYSITILILLSQLYLFAQPIELNCIIVDNETGRVMPYVNVGIVDKGIGAVSKSNGSFILNIPEENIKDSIRLSMVGYDELNKSIPDLEKRDTIFMNAKYYQLKEASIYVFDKHKVRDQRWNFESKFILLFSKGKGYEFGQLVKMKSKESRIDSVGVYIGNIIGDSILLRLNIYSILNEIPDELLLQKPIYTLVTRKDIANFVMIEVSTIVNEDVIISFEAVEMGDDERLEFKGNMGKGTFFQRSVSHSKWLSLPFIPVSMVMNVYLSQHDWKTRRMLKKKESQSD